MFALLTMVAAAKAEDLSTAFSSAADEYQVPEKLLLALSYQASHWHPEVTSTWGGYGLFDFVEDDSGPNIEQAAMLAGISPDDIIAEPASNIRAAAALLAWQGRLSNDGQLPPQDELIEWWDAVRGFSGRPEPFLQAMFADHVFELVNFGIDGEPGIEGLELEPEPVDHWDRVPVMPPTECDYSGCAQFVPASTSNYSNYSRGPSDIRYVIVHTVQGSYSGCISWFQNSSASVSAHYVVKSSDGEVTQMVKEEDVAWHAGNWDYNLASVGIEHEGYVEYPDTWYTDAMYASSAALVADICERNDIPISRSYILAHSEVPSATHTDPGSGWDWDYYMELIAEGGGSSTSTGDVIGVIADSDIYNGERIVGATVWIPETGDSTTSDSSGYYYFYDLPLDTYTIHADAAGYTEETCTKSLSLGDNWCSIALFPGDDPVDTGDPDTDDPAPDTGDPDTGPRGDPDVNPTAPPGNLVPMGETRGCGCTTPAGPTGLWMLGLLGLAAVQRRRLSA